MTDRRPFTDFGVKLDGLLKLFGIARKRVTRRLSISEGLLSQWMVGERHPSPEQIDTVSDLMKLHPETRAELHKLAAKQRGYDL